MISRKNLIVVAVITCLAVTLFLQIGVFANQTQTTTAGDFTVDAADYDVFYDCNRDGKVDMIDIFGCILRFGTEGDAVRISYISVPPADFQPMDETQSYYKDNFGIKGAIDFYANVRLPHGANVTKMTAWLLDDVNDGNVIVELQKIEVGVTIYAMASVSTGIAEMPGMIELTDDTISQPIINNNGYTYQLHLNLDYEDWGLALFAVAIEYEYTP